MGLNRCRSLARRFATALWLAAVVALGWAAPTRAQSAEPAGVDAIPLDLGNVLEDEPFEQRVEFDNPDGVEWVIDRVQLTPPWSVSQMTSRIPSGGRGGFTLRLSEPRTAGALDGVAILSFRSGRAAPLVFALSIEVVPRIEFRPRRGFVLAVERGESKEAAIEIVNHHSEALQLDAVTLSDPRLTGALEVLEPGRRYRLSIRLQGQGEAGHGSAEARLFSSDPTLDERELRVPVLFVLREAVYTFPDAVDFGAFPRAQLRDPAAAQLVEQTLLVFRKGEPGFEVRVLAAPPYLRVRAERGGEGDRWQLTLSLDPESTPAGELAGTVVLETNDSRFPRLEVPFSAVLSPPTR